MQNSRRESALPPWKALANRSVDAPELLAAFNVRHPPVDVHDIARRMGLEVRETETATNWAGALDLRYETPIVWVNRADVWRRKRFTVAHEIGHLMLHHIPEDVVHRDTRFSGDWRERDANDYAARLLMPAEMLRALVSPFARPNPAVLADRFEVSDKAMEYRLVNLGLMR
jgi:Zn-dependent peptidase ImmA (M78 family)